MHPSWKKREEEEWAHLAPGIRWLCKPLLGETLAEALEVTKHFIASLEHGRAELDEIGFEGADLGVLADVDVLAGLSVLRTAMYVAEKIVIAWENMDDPETGEPIEFSKDALRQALRKGPPEGGLPMFQPFMAWLHRSQLPIAGDLRRLRALTKWEHVGGLEHCRGCDLAGAECARGGTDDGTRCPRSVNAPRTAPGMAAYAASRLPGVWVRSGIAGQLTGLDYGLALQAVQADGVMDEGAFMRCLAAIEAGALEAAAERNPKEPN